MSAIKHHKATNPKVHFCSESNNALLPKYSFYYDVLRVGIEPTFKHVPNRITKFIKRLTEVLTLVLVTCKVGVVGIEPT